MPKSVHDSLHYTLIYYTNIHTSICMYIPMHLGTCKYIHIHTCVLINLAWKHVQIINQFAALATY